MKAISKTIILGSFIAASLVLNSCQKELVKADSFQYASLLQVSSDGISTIIEANMKSALVQTTALSDDELTFLLKMKEEEKLARDVYSVLYKKWGSQIFSNIAAAESNHLNAVILLLTNYGVTNTLIGEPGVFTDDAVQKLFNDLVARANLSIEEAYKTGAFIEEMDIKDLTTAPGITVNENVTMVVENLLKGSRNHLRAFNRQLNMLGVDYTPAYISQTDYDLIVNAAIEKGKQYRMNGKGIGQGKGQKRNGNRGNGGCNN